MNCELPEIQAGFRKSRETKDQFVNICWIIEKQESSRKASTSALLSTPKPLTMWITTNCGPSAGAQTPYCASVYLQPLGAGKERHLWQSLF